MVKKSHRTKVSVRSRQALVQQNRSVQWPSEPSRELVHPPMGGTDNDDDEPESLPLALANRIDVEDDQPVLHIDNILDEMDEDGVIDRDDDSGDYLDMSDWESD